MPLSSDRPPEDALALLRAELDRRRTGPLAEGFAIARPLLRHVAPLSTACLDASTRRSWDYLLLGDWMTGLASLAIEDDALTWAGSMTGPVAERIAEAARLAEDRLDETHHRLRVALVEHPARGAFALRVDDGADVRYQVRIIDGCLISPADLELEPWPGSNGGE